MKMQELPIIALLLLIFASCGTANASTLYPAQSVALPTVLHVVRPATLNNVPRYERTIRDVATVQALYKAANALPIHPAFHGTINCPADLAIEYQLSFLRNTTLLESMNVFPTGCRFVKIVQDTSHIYTLTDDFSVLLANTIGLSSLVPKIE